MSTLNYPCGHCREEVKDDEEAVFCEGECYCWFHASCAGLNTVEYCQLTEDEIWRCTSCVEANLPAHNTKDAVDVFHFDFQKNLPTPKITVGHQFYLRLLWTYLFGIYCASTELTAAYMWHESLAKRGANDVISCLAHFIFRNPLGRSGAKWSIWWADNCAGQNKNNAMIWFFQDLIRRGIYSRIDLKFLVVGHTYGPTDRTFGVIEKYTSKLESVCTPEQWYNQISLSTPTVQVTVMDQDNFKDYRQHLRKLYTERNQDIDHKPLNFNTGVWFNFGCGESTVGGETKLCEHPQEVWVRHSYEISEMPQRVSYFKKRGKQDGIDAMPPFLYTQNPIPIKKAKADDLLKLLEYIPAKHHSFYTNLPALDDESENED